MSAHILIGIDKHVPRKINFKDVRPIRCKITVDGLQQVADARIHIVVAGKLGHAAVQGRLDLQALPDLFLDLFRLGQFPVPAGGRHDKQQQHGNAQRQVDHGNAFLHELNARHRDRQQKADTHGYQTSPGQPVAVLDEQRQLRQHSHQQDQHGNGKRLTAVVHVLCINIIV